MGNQFDNQDVFIDDDWNPVINPDEDYWNRLIDEIIEGNVVPVVGPDMLVENCNNIHQTIIEIMKRKFNITGNVFSFSELAYHYEYHNYHRNQLQKHDSEQKQKYDFFQTIDSIYYYVDSFLNHKRLQPSSLLQRLLSFRQFPFVITTSFTPVVENTMKEIWGDELSVLKFCNIPTEIADIRDENSLRSPTVYYMFGKHCSNPHRYALTDTDMLDYCSSWLSGSREKKPINLVSALSKKYLLMIGNNYSDWLFRFIWYSIRKGKMGQGMLAYNKVEEPFLHFLDRSNAFSCKDPSEVIEQIESRLTARLQDIESRKFNQVEMNTDVFISYSRRDKDVAEKVYNALTNLGKKVWYDKKNLGGGSIFMEDINRAINTARYFVPIFTNNVTMERNDSHVYRTEWDKAINVATSMGRTFIIPLASNDFDFYGARIPERIQKHNAVTFGSETNWDEIAQQLLHIMNQN